MYKHSISLSLSLSDQIKSNQIKSTNPAVIDLVQEEEGRKEGMLTFTVLFVLLSLEELVEELGGLPSLLMMKIPQKVKHLRIAREYQAPVCYP